MKNLKDKAITGIKWTTFGSIILMLIQFSQNVILARILMPEDFGLMAIVLVVIGLLSPFIDMGFSSAIIHKKEITQLQLSSLYWLNVVFGLICFIIIFITAPFISLFFEDEQLTHLIRLTSLVFLISPWGTQYTALFAKNLRFDLQNKIAIISLFSSFVLAIVLAVTGFGVLSLLCAYVLNSVLNSLLSILYGQQFNKITLAFDWVEIRGLVNFGLFQVGTQSINFLSANLDKILIEKFLGSYFLGLYSIAWNLMVIPLTKINPIINRVVFPVFSKIQNESAQIQKYYSHAVGLLLLVNTPIYLTMIFASEEILFVLFGSQWIEADVVLSLLGIVGLLKCISNPSGALFLSKGRADINFYWNILWTISLFSILTFIINKFPGIEQVAFGQLIAVLFLSPILHLIVIKIGNINYTKLLKEFFLIFLFSLFIYFVFSIINSFNLSIEISLIIKLLTLFSFYIIYVFMFFKNYANLIIQAIK